jgi:hypothetical protein
MNFLRLVVAIVMGCGLSSLSLLRADDSAAPFSLGKQYSTETVITTKDGTNLTSKSFFDEGKLRTEMNAHGMQMVTIVRPDLKKVYQVMVAQRMVMEMPYDPDKFKKQTVAATGPEGKFEVVGPETVDGVACTKYKVTTKDNKVFFYWINTAQKLPVKMAAEDGSFTLVWKNYKAGPQDASLFVPPADFQPMTMPAMPSSGSQ